MVNPPINNLVFAKHTSGGKMAKKIQIAQMFKRVASSIFTKPATTEYPFVKPKLQQNLLGQPIVDTALCVGCGTCSRDCPSRAIEMVQVGGKTYPQFRLDRCIFCLNCAELCPRKAIKNSLVFELATTDKSTLVVTPQPLVIG
jgi:formate hydrogenlyase subunit 6/NADH:ubiquinone oxidoreductase subunit I